MTQTSLRKPPLEAATGRYLLKAVAGRSACRELRTGQPVANDTQQRLVCFDTKQPPFWHFD
jgi:hypothetical protein